MGSLKQDDFYASETGSAKNFIVSSLNKNGLINGKIEVQNLELLNKLLKFKPKAQDVELENKVLKYKLKDQDLRQFNEKLRDELKKIRSKMPTEMKDAMLYDRFNLLRYTFERVRSGESDVQFDLDFGGRPALLEEIFPSPADELAEKPPEDFKIYVECKQFKPNELKVIVKGGAVIVHARHDSKPDEHGFIKREFKYSWSLPEDVVKGKFSCLLDRYGILTLRAPRIAPKFIPVQTQKVEDSDSLEDSDFFEM